MKYLVLVFVATIIGCSDYTYTEISEALLKNATCRCKDSGGVASIAVRAANFPSLETTVDSLYNFKCKDGLETGWWLYKGSMGELPLAACE